jgi:hypothetical protein
MEDIIPTWFVVSIIAEVLSSLWLRIWLGKRVRLSPARVGIPGYLEREYAAWCRQVKVSSRLVVVIRIALMVNLLAAACVGIPFLARS